jgi:hypothetical protein
MPDIRDNLMVTMAMRIAYMDCGGLIIIPGGLEGEDELARFIADSVDHYINCHVDGGELEDVNFDEYIENAIKHAY